MAVFFSKKFIIRQCIVLLKIASGKRNDCFFCYIKHMKPNIISQNKDTTTRFMAFGASQAVMIQFCMII